MALGAICGGLCMRVYSSMNVCVCVCRYLYLYVYIYLLDTEAQSKCWLARFCKTLRKGLLYCRIDCKDLTLLRSLLTRDYLSKLNKYFSSCEAYIELCCFSSSFFSFNWVLNWATNRPVREKESELLLDSPLCAVCLHIGLVMYRCDTLSLMSWKTFFFIIVAI